MKLHRLQSGFTLLELLITSVIFVVIATLTTSIFAGVSKLQVNRKGSQALAAQLNQVQIQFQDDFQNIQTYSFADPTVGIATVSGSSTQNNMLLLRRTATVSAGTTQGEWRIYCLAKDVPTGNTILTRFRIPYTPAMNGSVPSLATGASSACDATAVRGLLTINGATLQSTITDTLTDTQSTVSALSFAQVQSDPDAASIFTSQINAIRVQFAAQDSTTDSTGSPIVSRFQINRLTP